MGTVSTPGGAVCATVAGKAPSVMSPTTSASTSTAAATASASWGRVCVTLDTRGKTAKKVSLQLREKLSVNIPLAYFKDLAAAPV